MILLYNNRCHPAESDPTPFVAAQDLDHRGLPGAGHGVRRAEKEQERIPRLRLAGEEGGNQGRRHGESCRTMQIHAT